MNDQVIPVRRQADQVAVGQADICFAGSEPEGGAGVPQTPAKQPVHDPENRLGPFILIDIVIDVPVNGFVLVFLAGGQEDQADILVCFPDFRGGFDAGDSVHENIQKNDGKAVGGKGFQKFFPAGKWIQIKMKTVKVSVFG